MNKLYIFLLLLSSSLLGVDIPTQHTKLHSFGKSIELNSKIIQLSNAKQAVTSLVSGRLEKYYVKVGENVKVGQKIALIESITISKMTAEYISLKKQYISLNKNYDADKRLYDKGLISMHELNNLNIKKSSMNSKIVTLESQLKTLGIDTKKLKKATANFILYSHSSGRISKLQKSLHTVIKEDESLISIVKNHAFYIESYLPLEYGNVVKIGQKLTIEYNNKTIVTYITQILPELDTKTQRVVVLSSIDDKVNNLFINTYVASKLYFKPKNKYVAIKKSALSFFNNEWVVFIPTKEDKHDEHSAHNRFDDELSDDLDSEHNHDEDEEHDHKKDEKHEEKGHDEHDHEEESGHEEEEGEHDEHNEEQLPYEVRVVEIITQNDKYVAVRGIELGEEYVSDKSYYVKSMMLKSSLGGHGH